MNTGGRKALMYQAGLYLDFHVILVAHRLQTLTIYAQMCGTPCFMHQ